MAAPSPFPRLIRGHSSDYEKFRKERRNQLSLAGARVKAEFPAGLNRGLASKLAPAEFGEEFVESDAEGSAVRFTLQLHRLHID